MDDIKERLAKKHMEIFNKGWVQTHRNESGGIGRTYEDLLGIRENNNPFPDFEKKIEIKTHRKKSNSSIHLFGRTPLSIPNSIKYLSFEYGNYVKNKKFYTKITTNISNTNGTDYKFKLINDRKRKRLYIGVYDCDGNFLDDSIYYTYKDIKKGFKKLKNLFYIKAEHEINDDGVEEFKFCREGRLFSDPSFDTFLDLIDSGVICCEVMVSTYSHGKNKGKYRDHGTRFGLSDNYLDKLYQIEEIIKDGEVIPVRNGNSDYNFDEEVAMYILF